MRLRSRLPLFTLVALVASLVSPAFAYAQSGPAPQYYMYDSRPYNGYPPTYPGQSIQPQAVVVEGLGASLGSCPNSNYTEAKIESQTVAWINSVTPTVTEITPQAYCASLSAYESLISRIVSYVEAHASNPGNLWAGIMLDEEPGYQFSASSLEALNNYVSGVMVSTPGMSWFFLEDQPNGWTLATYNAILNAGSGWPAPQVYSSSMLSAVNGECSTYGKCTNLVTVGNLSSISPWNDPNYTLPKVNGAAWSTSYSSWLPYLGWWNGYRNQ